jgi:uncharacterized protein YdiU (UPF0061 family)
MGLEFLNSYYKLGEEFYSETEVEEFAEPIAIDFNEDYASEVGLKLGDEWLDYFSGRKKLKGGKTISTVYSGHQFGSYAPQLGDGRAHMLGGLKTDNGEIELQLKGSGKTPYSRFGDGKAVLRSSIREYLISEAMYHLGVPTTRALCVVGSDENVIREGTEKAAMVCRASPSFVRFGHFEYFTHTGKKELTKKLADYVINRFYPELVGDKDRYQKFLYKVVSNSAKLVAKWQSLGFAHGVLNTDNMSILGLTIDYGPYGFIDEYKPGFIPNASDYSGRYAFNNQPNIFMWNLNALAYALEPVVSLDEAREILPLFPTIFHKEYFDLMRKKLGLKTIRTEDEKLVKELLDIMDGNFTDYTLFFRELCDYEIDQDCSNFAYLFKKTDSINEWLQKYSVRLKREDWPEINRDRAKVNINRSKRMKRYNPKYILRNYMLENAIMQATHAKDYSEIKRLMKLVKKPYEEQPESENYAALPPDWSKSICISCSS